MDLDGLSDRQERAWRALQMMNMRLDGELARRLSADSALSYADYAVLVSLTSQPDRRMRQFELGRELGWEKSRLSHQVTRMAGRGLVAKEPCDSDRRGAYVVVTDHGLAEIRAAAPGHVRAVRELFVDVLTDEQIDTIGAAANAVLAELDRRDCATPTAPTVTDGAGGELRAP